MRILAGILILVVAAIDLVAGIVYEIVPAFINGLSGAFADGIVELISAPLNAQTAVGGQTAEMTLWQMFGLFLLLQSALAIGCAIALFKRKALKFALFVSVLQLGAEVVGIVIWNYFGVTNAIGFLAAILVILAVVKTERAKAKQAILTV